MTGADIWNVTLVLCGVQDTVCKDSSNRTNLETRPPVTTTKTTPPKDYVLYTYNRCLYKVLQSGRHTYPTSCKKLCLRRRHGRRLVQRRLPDFTKCMKPAEDFAERSLDSQQCIMGFCLHGVCQQLRRRVSCGVPGNETAPSSNAEK
ncbi:uncharacterized protein LOC142590276 isoform X2 [Dermacentor variabilis]|uniref:uncharacterized protein LOC142590276 isoform X2 n=1 Tax=Dermacentor variabilis TaxID=34621 RepID=UPI003F5C4F87